MQLLGLTIILKLFISWYMWGLNVGILRQGKFVLSCDYQIVTNFGVKQNTLSFPIKKLTVNSLGNGYEFCS